MNAALRGFLSVAFFAALAGIGFVGARYWQGQQVAFERLAGPPECVLQEGPCEQPLAAGTVRLSIAPQTIPLMQTLTLDVEVGELAPRAVAVDIRGLNMDMGRNRTVLTRSADGSWQGETILPICSQRRMEWEAAVQIEADRRWEVPFLFTTLRP